ncbi:MAG: methyltransferase domain-containing protein [Sphaerospermopsis sp. SIO1G2]|nr:methyltransferase domain-containing protein [Sphaerospermopsis sp. SIO1G2]
MFADGRFAYAQGKVIGLEPSGKMLAIAQEKLAPYLADVSLVQQTAVPLPFPDDTFDAITCLEAIEFFPDPEEALREMGRVLKSDGVLLTTRRTGWESQLFFGRAYTQAEFEQILVQIGFTEAFSFQWEAIYDLVIARKLP